jgi:hypothetical protein
MQDNLDGPGGGASSGLSKDVAGSWEAYPAALLLRHKVLPNSPAAGLSAYLSKRVARCMNIYV